MSKVLKSKEVDSTGLRKLLQEIAAQLTVSYLKKRATANLHKQSVIEELQDAITYISEKERELQVALDIAKHLLDCNEDLQVKVVRMKEDQNALIYENKALINDIKSYQSLMEEKEIKYEKTSLTLAKTEGELMKLSVDLQTGHNRKSSDEGLLDNDSFEKELYEMHEEIQKYKRKKHVGNLEETEKKYHKVLVEKEKIELNLSSSKEQYENLCNKHKKTVDKLKEQERVQKILLHTNEKLEKKSQDLKNINEKLLQRLERLEEDAKILENSGKTKASESIQESNSLLYELQCLKEPEKGLSESDDEFFSPKPHSRLLKRQYTYTPNSNVQDYHEYFSIVHYLSVGVVGKQREARKDPSEEYFILATQAIKMNSPHMDTICVIPHSVLYQKVKEDNIPFHKWYWWIETQLNFEYIQTIYRQKPKIQGFRRFLKRF